MSYCELSKYIHFVGDYFYTLFSSHIVYFIKLRDSFPI